MAVSNINAASLPDVKEALKNWGTTKGYMVSFVCTGPEKADNFTICCNMQEKFSISLGAQWSQPFAKMTEAMNEALGGSALSGLLGMAGQTFGLSGQSKCFTASVWESTSPLGFSLPLQLRAFNDEAKEVRDNLIKLLCLAAPSEKLQGAVLQAPGPTIAGNLANWLNSKGATSLSGRNIRVEIGNFMVLDQIVVGNVSGDIDMILSGRDIPLNATVNVDIATFYASTTVQDIYKIFKLAPPQ